MKSKKILLVSFIGLLTLNFLAYGVADQYISSTRKLDYGSYSGGSYVDTRENDGICYSFDSEGVWYARIHVYFKLQNPDKYNSVNILNNVAHASNEDYWVIIVYGTDYDSTDRSEIHLNSDGYHTISLDSNKTCYWIGFEKKKWLDDFSFGIDYIDFK
ncbi:MAG: hypothetical protein K9W44_00710 [Candidatus Lokiarchaeota archaeon]|nr:hypothetical protein [Candidatus Harpocratesius repetitus]